MKQLMPAVGIPGVEHFRQYDQIGVAVDRRQTFFYRCKVSGSIILYDVVWNNGNLEIVFRHLQYRICLYTVR